MFQKKFKLKWLKTSGDAKLPEVSYSGESACFDFFASENVEIKAKELGVVPLNLKVIIPKGYFLFILNKSSIENKMRCRRLGGVIDRGYTENLDIRLFNEGSIPQYIKKGQKVAQGLLLPVYNYQIEECSEEEFSKYRENSKRKEGGFGSSEEEKFKIKG